ncbi:hypothetical protein [Singulisphaera sp. PoT]|uniref:hypothetical protein n=1 Tax=Singulisphaera sp. PoT TaxID=3411797 RepID=UPI003BF49164
MSDALPCGNFVHFEIAQERIPMSDVPSLRLIGVSNSFSHLPALSEGPSPLTAISAKWRRVYATEYVWQELDETVGMVSTVINATRMWRAVGSPAGYDPKTWLELAKPIVHGLSAYVEKLRALPGEFDDDFDIDFNVFTQRVDVEHRGERAGDDIFAFVLAYAYACLLDSRTVPNSQA